jgi:hypothetical protein
MSTATYLCRGPDAAAAITARFLQVAAPGCPVLIEC